MEHFGGVYFSAEDKANIFCQTFAEKCWLDDSYHLPQEASVQCQVMLYKIIFKPKDNKKDPNKMVDILVDILSSQSKLVFLTEFPAEQESLERVFCRTSQPAHCVISSHLASLGASSQTSQRLSLSFLFTKEIPKLIQHSINQCPCEEASLII